MKIEAHLFAEPLTLYKKRCGWFKKVSVKLEQHLDGGKDRYTLRIDAASGFKYAYFSREELDQLLKTLRHLREKGVIYVAMEFGEHIVESLTHKFALRDWEISAVIDALEEVLYPAARRRVPPSTNPYR